MRKVLACVLVFAMVTSVFILTGIFNQSAYAASLFSDNFESYTVGNAPSGGWTVSGGTWTVVTDGTKVVKQTNSATTYLYNGTSTWTNYSISADVKTGSSSVLNGILGRYVDTNNFYSLALKSGNVVLKKKVSGSWTTLGTTAYSFNTSTFYTLKLEMNGTAIKGYVNGTQKISVTDSSLTSGKIALRNEATCSYDNVAVNDFATATPTPVPTQNADVQLSVASATASSYDTVNNCPPANAIDSNLSTRWAAQGDPQWIKFDLGMNNTVNYLNIAWYQGDARKTTFDIKLSTDDTNYTTVFSGQSSGITANFEKYSFASSSARYVQIVGHGNTLSTWNSISEVQIFGISGGLTPTPTVTPTPVPGGRVVTCASTTEIQNALKNALAGDPIIIKTGTYTGSTSTSGNSGAYFYSAVNGTASQHIIVKSENASSPAILQGTDNNSAYVFYLTGNYWEVRDLKFTKGKKGIMLDNSNYTYLYNDEVYNTGEEGIHLRDGSSNNIVDSCKVHDTGVVTADYGEAMYVGSDYTKWSTLIKECDNNTIKNCILGPNVAAEHVDIKEGTTGTIIEGCTFNGTGMSGANGGDSFIDYKGNNAVIKNNIGYRNNCSYITDAFQVHQKQSGWGLNNDFNGNTVYMDNTSCYVILTDSNSTAKAHNNTRSPSGNMYIGNVTQY